MSVAKTLAYALPWWLAAAVGVQAYTSFDPVCTRPADSVNFVSSPDARGTMEILWSSLFTIVACTWTIHHPNVPEQRDGRDPGFLGDLRWGLWSALESAKLALVTILTPELIISVAWDQRRIAKKVMHELKERADRDGVPWTLVHGHYVAMGGFVLRSNALECGRGGKPYHLTADDVILLRTNDNIERLPNLTRDEITDKSKSDPVMKGIAICQILWSIAQIATREIRQLPISLLELNVLALAACAICIYLLCWSKPKHVQVAVTVRTYNGDLPEELKEKLEQPEMSAAWVILFETAQALQIIPTTHPKMGQPLSNTRVQLHPHEKEKETGKSGKSGVAASLFLAATIFGAVHMAGWNITFPTKAEQIIWRCAIIYILTLPTLIFLLHCIGLVLFSRILRLEDEVIDPLLGIGGTILCWLYLAARLFILAETARTFISLPPGMFISTWTRNIPHFS
ncbi:hypothetical protein B0T16DRAFT_407809 [Cercophora newfieldiana]|uniref:Uncharacterized protein n=1 Tax=Cercophora newfieldiana TaxID=92897 RepID=A0AA39YAY8_9PEZI|nr:hypothetical protein B0T16DRAFT_407809 [Cercophora newfieldiana]